MVNSITDADASTTDLTISIDDNFVPIKRERFSPIALQLIDRYNLENANDPMVFVLAALDQYNRAQSDRVEAILADHSAHEEPESRLINALDQVLQRQRDCVTQLEAATVSTAIEFGRIGLALKRMETIETALSQVQTEFKSTARKIQKRDAWSIALNFAFALLYVMMGAVTALLAMHLALKWHLF
jgi:hypothetical protein